MHCCTSSVVASTWCGIGVNQHRYFNQWISTFSIWICWNKKNTANHLRNVSKGVWMHVSTWVMLSSDNTVSPWKQPDQKDMNWKFNNSWWSFWEVSWLKMNWFSLIFDFIWSNAHTCAGSFVNSNVDCNTILKSSKMLRYFVLYEILFRFWFHCWVFLMAEDPANLQVFWKRVICSVRCCHMVGFSCEILCFSKTLWHFLFYCCDFSETLLRFWLSRCVLSNILFLTSEPP